MALFHLGSQPFFSAVTLSQNPLWTLGQSRLLPAASLPLLVLRLFPLVRIALSRILTVSSTYNSFLYVVIICQSVLNVVTVHTHTHMRRWRTVLSSPLGGQAFSASAIFTDTPESSLNFGFLSCPLSPFLSAVTVVMVVVCISQGHMHGHLYENRIILSIITFTLPESHITFSVSCMMLHNDEVRLPLCRPRG